MAVVCIIVTVTCILIQLVLKIFPMIVAYFSFWIKEWFKFWGKPQIYLIESRELTIEWFSFILKTKLQKKKQNENKILWAIDSIVLPHSSLSNLSLV